MNDTATGFPGFAPGEHRQLLADVHRWARTNGWHTDRDTGWQDPSRLTQVDWEERGLHIGSRDSVDRLWTTRHWPAANVRQAVDILAAIGLLPASFSSGYQLGRSDAAFIANTDARPDRTCLYCGATSGLLMVRCDVLELTPMQWQCSDDCQAVTR